MIDKVYKVGREYLSWGPETCDCFHSEKVHGKNKCEGVAGNNFDEACECKSYRPKDNLIFLEKKYEELSEEKKYAQRNLPKS